ENNAPPDPDLAEIASTLLQASDVSRPRKSVRNSPHSTSIAPGPKIQPPARNVHSLCMHPPVTPEYTTQAIRHLSPVPFPNLSESRQYLAQTHLAGHLPIRAKSKPWPDSAQTHVLHRVRLRHWPGLRQRQRPRETGAPGG